MYMNPNETHAAATNEQLRSSISGQYENKLDAMCTCGHTMGAHLAEGPHECVADGCFDCAKFRKSRAKKTTTK